MNGLFEHRSVVEEIKNNKKKRKALVFGIGNENYRFEKGFYIADAELYSEDDLKRINAAMPQKANGEQGQYLAKFFHKNDESLVRFEALDRQSDQGDWDKVEQIFKTVFGENYESLKIEDVTGWCIFLTTEMMAKIFAIEQQYFLNQKKAASIGHLNDMNELEERIVELEKELENAKSK